MARVGTPVVAACDLLCRRHDHLERNAALPASRGRQDHSRGRRFENPPRPPRNNLLPFYERFEVVETFFETLAIHALDDERVSDLADYARRQHVVERRR
jgi:hypothetical protein